jgi:hypothetical protein
MTRRGAQAGGRITGALALVLLGILAIPACARRGPPSGGPPDLVSPKVAGSVPDSGAARVPPDAGLSVSFTKSMEPRTTGEAVSIAPRVEIRQRRWHGKTLTLVLAETLRTRQTYTLFVGLGARDRHGNTLEKATAVTFSTGDSFPPGGMAGEIQALGFAAPGTYLWVYGGGRAPDSTARDFDALGLADAEGSFRISGLPAPASYRIWGFADLNGNRSFEPETDVLAAADTVIALTHDHPVASKLLLRMTNPRAPGRVKGAVVDSTGDSLGVIRVVAISGRDSTRRVAADADDHGVFQLELQAGPWTIRAWRDADKNHAWRVDLEPASAPARVDVTPASEIADLRLTLRRRSEGP